MKTSSKFLIAGCILIPTCLILFIAGITGLIVGKNPAYVILLFIGFYSLVPSISLLVVGLRPFTTRIKSKIQSESIDYAEQEIAEASNKTVDVSSTAIEKVAKIVAKANEQETIFCEHCGTKLNADAKFCSNCGKKIIDLQKVIESKYGKK